MSHSKRPAESRNMAFSMFKEMVELAATELDKQGKTFLIQGGLEFQFLTRVFTYFYSSKVTVHCQNDSDSVCFSFKWFGIQNRLVLSGWILL